MEYQLNLVTFAKIIFCVHTTWILRQQQIFVGTDLNQVEEKVARDSINSILVKKEGGNESDLIASSRAKACLKTDYWHRI